MQHQPGLRALPVRLALPARRVQKGPAGPAGPAGPHGPEGAAGLDYRAATFVGSSACKECHEELYDTYQETGHAWALNPVVDGKAPAYPITKLKDAPEGLYLG